jgi:hypothetical protein
MAILLEAGHIGKKGEASQKSQQIFYWVVGIRQGAHAVAPSTYVAQALTALQVVSMH